MKTFSERMGRITIRQGLLLLLVSGAFNFAGTTANAQQSQQGFQVPEGFEVSLYADDSLASDIHALTIDSKGRVVVAGRGYIKILHDTKGTGKADKATLFADLPKSGAHGMYFDGNDLICNGDKGVRRLYDTKGVGTCDKVSPIWFPTKNDGEHSANGIVRGPDGWYYMISGNDAGIGKAHAAGPRSPVKDPGAGTVVRFSPDGKTQEVVAHGFRNPYDLAFNHLGNLFTVDADGERVYHMPYYAPTRLFDVASGMHHGWLYAGWRGSWSRPACWPDNVARLVEIGRGSPTGLVVYRHHAFPERYRNGVFSLCWTFGRLYFFPLNRDGSTYSSKMEVFMKTTGDVGFAPTDMAVGPNGDLFIAIGGRGTRGSVFKVSYKRGLPLGERPGDPLRSVLAADEPLSSWSRAQWVPKARKLGKEAFTTALMNADLSLDQRIRAVEILTELFDGVPVDTARSLCVNAKTDPELTARMVWSLARTAQTAEPWKIIMAVTRGKDARSARAAWEALLTKPASIKVAFDVDWAQGMRSRDRRVRFAAIETARRMDRAGFVGTLGGSFENSLMVAQLWIDKLAALPTMPVERATFFGVCVHIVTVEKSVPLRMEAVRLLQLALGDVAIENGPATKPFWGYQAGGLGRFDPVLLRETADRLAKSFPTGNAELDQELARLLGMLGENVPGLPSLVAGRWTKASPVASDIHYLLAFARIPGLREQEVTRQTAAALNGIQVKLAAQGAKPADQVPGILEGLLERLVQLDPNLPAALVNDPAFGNPGHTLYANKLPLKDKRAATRKLLAHIARLNAEDGAMAWSPELVRLVGVLPENEALPLLRARFTDARLMDAVALQLAEKHQLEDRPRLVDALSSLQGGVMGAAAEALLTLPAGKEKSAKEIGKAVRALRRLEGQKTDGKAQAAVGRLLTHWTGQKLKADKQGPAAAWADWFTKNYPGEAVISGPTGTNFKAWQKRLAAIDWSQGDVRRGAVVFQRRNCFACHAASRRLGPELTGIAQRFSRADLFQAIIDPSKDISPAFVATVIVTTNGKVYNGMMIYTSDQLYLLQTTPDTTVRIPGEEVVTVQPSTVSFMPAGLLEDTKDGDLADLYAYLASLRKK